MLGRKVTNLKSSLKKLLVICQPTVFRQPFPMLNFFSITESMQSVHLSGLGNALESVSDDEMCFFPWAVVEHD